MTKEIIGLDKAVTIKSIFDIAKERIVYGELLKGNKRVSEVEITEPFNKDRVDEFVRLRLVTSENDIIYIYFCSDYLYFDVNGRGTYRKMFDTKKLHKVTDEQEKFSSLELKQNSIITSEIKIDNNEYNFFKMRLTTTYGELFNIEVDGNRFEMTKTSDNFSERAKGLRYATFILAEVIYNNECFCDDIYNGEKQIIN